MMWLVKIIHAGASPRARGYRWQSDNRRSDHRSTGCFSRKTSTPCLKKFGKDLDTDDKISVDDAMKIISSIAG